MNLYVNCLYLITTLGSACKIGEIELDLVPSFVETHGHGAYERFDTGGGLVVGCTEATHLVLVVKDTHLETELFFQVLNDHD